MGLFEPDVRYGSGDGKGCLDLILKDKQDLIIPLGPADYFGVGFGVDIDNNAKLGLAISYLKAYVSVASGQSDNANSTDIDNLIYNPYAGLPFTNTTDVLFFNFSYQENF